MSIGRGNFRNFRYFGKMENLEKRNRAHYGIGFSLFENRSNKPFQLQKPPFTNPKLNPSPSSRQYNGANYIYILGV